MAKPTQWSIVSSNLSTDGETLYNKADHLWPFWENTGTTIADQIGTNDLAFGTGNVWTTDGAGDICVELGNGDNAIDSSGNYTMPTKGALLLVLEHDGIDTGADRIFCDEVPGTNRVMELYWENHAVNGQRLRFDRVYNSNLWHQTGWNPTGLVLNATVTVLIEWDTVADEWEIFVNGSSVGGRQTGWAHGSAPDPQRLIFGSNALASATQFKGKYKLAALLNDVTTAAERSALTTDPYVMIRDEGGPAGSTVTQTPNSIGTLAGITQTVTNPSAYFHLVPLVNTASGGTATELTNPPTMDIRETTGAAQAAVPYSFGIVFEKGAIPAGDRPLLGLDGTEDVAQPSVRNYWGDGSAKYVVFAGVTALGANEIKPFTFKKITDATAYPGAVLTVNDFPAGFDKRIKITEGTAVYWADLGPLLASAPDPWIQGPDMSEWKFKTPLLLNGSVDFPHDFLDAVWWVRLFKDGTVEVIDGIDNSKTRVPNVPNYIGWSLDNLNAPGYDLEILYKDAGGNWSADYTETGVKQNHHSICRRGPHIWKSGSAQSRGFEILYDGMYMMERARIIPKFQSYTWNRSYTGNNGILGRMYTSYNSYERIYNTPNVTVAGTSQAAVWTVANHGPRNSFANTGVGKHYMRNPTWYGDLSPTIPEWELLWVFSTFNGAPRSERADLWRWMTNTGRKFGSYEMHFTDENTGYPTKPTDEPQAINYLQNQLYQAGVFNQSYANSLYPVHPESGFDKANTPTRSNFGWDTSHRACPAMSAMVEGWRDMAEELHHLVTSGWMFEQVTFPEDTPSGAERPGSRIHAQGRAQGNRLRDLAYALALLPDNYAPRDADIRDVHLENTLNDYWDLYNPSTGTERNPAGFLTRANYSASEYSQFMGALWEYGWSTLKTLDVGSTTVGYGGKSQKQRIQDVLDYVVDGKIALYKACDPAAAPHGQGGTTWKFEIQHLERPVIWGLPEIRFAWRTRSQAGITLESMILDTYTKYGETPCVQETMTQAFANEIAAKWEDPAAGGVWVDGPHDYMKNAAGQILKFKVTPPHPSNAGWDDPFKAYPALIPPLRLTMAIEHTSDPYKTGTYSLQNHWDNFVGRPFFQSHLGLVAGHSGGTSGPPWDINWEIEPRT